MMAKFIELLIEKIKEVDPTLEVFNFDQECPTHGLAVNIEESEPEDYDPTSNAKNLKILETGLTIQLTAKKAHSPDEYRHLLQAGLADLSKKIIRHLEDWECKEKKLPERPPEKSVQPGTTYRSIPIEIKSFGNVSRTWQSKTVNENIKLIACNLNYSLRESI